MYEDKFVNAIESGKQYKLGVINEFISKNNYHLYSKTIGLFIGNSEQRLCIVSKVINHEYDCLSNPKNSETINSQKVNGIIFAEYA